MNITVHLRIHQRHPNITNEDVLHAYRSLLVKAYRGNNIWLLLGMDGHGRILELIYKYIEHEQTVLIFHAFTPPTKKFIKELQQLRSTSWTQQY